LISFVSNANDVPSGASASPAFPSNNPEYLSLHSNGFADLKGDKSLNPQYKYDEARNIYINTKGDSLSKESLIGYQKLAEQQYLIAQRLNSELREISYQKFVENGGGILINVPATKEVYQTFLQEFKNQMGKNQSNPNSHKSFFQAPPSYHPHSP